MEAAQPIKTGTVVGACFCLKCIKWLEECKGPSLQFAGRGCGALGEACVSPAGSPVLEVDRHVVLWLGSPGESLEVP